VSASGGGGDGVHGKGLVGLVPTVTIVVNAGEEKVIIEEVFDEADPFFEDESRDRDDQGDGDDGFVDFG
jgi:hypothetical protein